MVGSGIFNDNFITYSHTYPCTDADPNSRAYADPNTGSDTDANPDTGSDPDTDTYANPHAGSDANADADAGSNPHTDPNCRGVLCVSHR